MTHTIQLIALISVAILIGCSRPQKITVQIDDTPEGGAKSAISVEYYELSSARIKYSNRLAIEYAKKFAAQDNNACNKFLYDPDPAKNLSDCSHFVAHVLKAGGIVIEKKPADPNLCPEGLAYKNAEIVAALKDLATRYENVKEIAVDEAIVGDLGFFNKFNVSRPTHGFMICEAAADPKDFKVWAHTTRRNCEQMQPDWMTFFDTAFRLEDGP